MTPGPPCPGHRLAHQAPTKRESSAPHFPRTTSPGLRPTPEQCQGTEKHHHSRFSGRVGVPGYTLRDRLLPPASSALACLRHHLPRLWPGLEMLEAELGDTGFPGSPPPSPPVHGRPLLSLPLPGPPGGRAVYSRPGSASAPSGPAAAALPKVSLGHSDLLSDPGDRDRDTAGICGWPGRPQGLPAPAGGPDGSAQPGVPRPSPCLSPVFPNSPLP